MNTIVSRMLGRACALAEVEPLIALFLGAALLAVLLSTLLKPVADSGGGSSLVWTLYRNLMRLVWAVSLVALLAGSVAVLRTYLRQTVAGFQRSHGRITEANYNAVQTIWGAEQQQGELKAEIYHEEEVTERIEWDDLTKPAVLRKKTVRRNATGNPFVTERHQVTLRQNPRRKGSALYGGYETECRFMWRLRNPSGGPESCDLVFPLPAAGAMYDALSVTFNGQDVLPQMRIKEASLVLSRSLAANEVVDFQIAFKSRGLSTWYFQVREAREIRDFVLTLNLSDLPKGKLNYPEGCMTPTDVRPTADAQGCVLTYHLDHALSDKGMGVAMPKLPQPGETTRAVLGETDRAWMLCFALITLSLTLAGVRNAVLVAVLFGAGTAFGYSLLAGFSDLLFGFWGTATLVLVPLFLALAFLLTRAAGDMAGRLAAVQLLILGIVYPCVAGLDADRQTLYLNLCALMLLAFTAWLLLRRFGQSDTGPERKLVPAGQVA